MDALTLVVVAAWVLLALWFARDGYHYARAVAAREGVADDRLVSAGHGRLMAACRLGAAIAVLALVGAVLSGAAFIWLGVGAPAVIIVFGLAGFLGTRWFAARHHTPGAG